MNELSLTPMRDVPQDSLIRSLRLMAPMFGHGPREDTARYAADELERVILEKRVLISEIRRLSDLVAELRDIAPHGDSCASLSQGMDERYPACTCWKG